nr:exonuclease SbcC [Rhodococcus sp. (in: high G+C Gram-positive bacteria)]
MHSTTRPREREVTNPMPGDFDLSVEELRVVARYAADCAQISLSTFEACAPTDVRPRHAIDAAYTFANGAPRTNLQRVAAQDAHRAAKDVGDESAQLAARAAGDAAAASYLHPIARSTQVGHILRAAACSARVAELDAGGDTAAADESLTDACFRATPTLVDVLLRYPSPRAGTTRVTQLMSELDSLLRRTYS